MGTTCLPTTDPDNNWSFCPSLPAAILFAVLFGLTTILHIYQAARYKLPFLWVLIMGAAWEAIAFIFRALAVQNPTSQGFYDPQFLLILLAPLWINASDYILLGRMAYYYLPDRKIYGIRAEKLGKIFVWLDITTFIIQLAGGFMTVGQNSSNNDDSSTNIVNIGLKVYTAGIGVQAFVILCFLSLAISFQRRIRTETNPVSAGRARRLLYVLYASLGLIFFRIIYRMIEFASGNDSAVTNNIESHEWYAYVFDSAPMFIALALFNIVHPGLILDGSDGELPNRRELKRAAKEKKRAEKEMKKERKAAKRAAKKDGMELV